MARIGRHAAAAVAFGLLVAGTAGCGAGSPAASPERSGTATVTPGAAGSASGQPDRPTSTTSGSASTRDGTADATATDDSAGDAGPAGSARSADAGADGSTAGAGSDGTAPQDSSGPTPGDPGAGAGSFAAPAVLATAALGCTRLQPNGWLARFRVVLDRADGVDVVPETGAARRTGAGGWELDLQAPGPAAGMSVVLDHVMVGGGTPFRTVRLALGPDLSRRLSCR